jgi:prepilin-type N-terminal cleavage/methylation domain-containing protein
MSRKPPAKHQAAFTLPEVMITMLLISMMCLGTFAGMQQVSKAMTAVAIRSEAHRVLQAEAERLLSTEYTSFSPSAEQTVSSSFKPSFIPYNSTGPGPCARST